MEIFNTYFLDVLKTKYALFDGRARRKEYWMFVLVVVVISVVLSILGSILGSIAGFLGTIFSIISGLFSLAILVPSIGLAIRRLHDINKSGWFYLLAFIPLVNFYLIYLLATEGTKGDNQYGPDPKAGEHAA